MSTNTQSQQQPTQQTGGGGQHNQQQQHQHHDPHDNEDDLGPESDPLLFKMYFQCLTKPWAKYCVISTWVLVLILGLFFAPLLLQRTQLSITAPHSAASYTAKEKMKKSFDTLVSSNYVLIFSQCITDECLNGTQTIENVTITDGKYGYARLQKELLRRYNVYKSEHSKRFYNFSDLYTSYNTCTTYSDPSDYPTGTAGEVNRTCIESVREAYISRDRTSGITVIQHEDDMNDVARHSLLDWLDDVEDDFNSYSSGIIHTRYTGEVALWNDMQEESKRTIESHLYLVPLILIIFGYTIGSWRLTLIPIVAMVICMNIAFMLLLPWADVLTVSTMTPTLMTSISLAMCIDYNLFMLVRFREEIGDERDVLRMTEVFEALRKTIRWSGEVVLVSGFILALSLMGYIFCSVEFLQSYGLGTAITVGCAIVINLTLTPSILLLFPSFFTQFGFNCRRTTIIDDLEGGGAHGGEEVNEDSTGYGTNQNQGLLDGKKTGDDKETELSLVGADAKDKDSTDKPKSDPEHGDDKAGGYMDFKVNADDPFRPFEVTPDDEANVFQRCWFVCGTWTTLFPCSLIIILVVYALILPITVEVGDIEISYAQTLEVPRDSTHWETFGDIQDYFSSGLIGPMYLLIRAPSGTSIFNYTYINDTSDFFQEVVKGLNNTVGQIDHVNGVSVMNGKYLGGASNETKYYYETYLVRSKLYHALVDVYAGKKNAEAYFSMLTHDDPNGFNCKRMVNRIRDVVNPTCRRLLKPKGYSCYYYSNTVETIDAIHDLYTTFPWILLVTMIVIFIIAGIIWKNKFLPLRLFLTIAMPMFMIYGMAVLVYQHGWLSWFNTNSVGRIHGISWIIPLMTITLLFGLALDYDIFLWSRIDEYMKHGVPLRPAIVRGVFKTGSIITAAGLIMASAFSGLFFSTVPALNQAGFIMVSSVLVDTFLIRTTLVPSILSISMNVTWHPKWKERVYGCLGWPLPTEPRRESDHKETDQLLGSD